MHPNTLKSTHPSTYPWREGLHQLLQSNPLKYNVPSTTSSLMQHSPYPPCFTFVSVSSLSSSWLSTSSEHKSGIPFLQACNTTTNPPFIYFPNNRINKYTKANTTNTITKQLNMNQVVDQLRLTCPAISVAVLFSLLQFVLSAN